MARLSSEQRLELTEAEPTGYDVSGLVIVLPLLVVGAGGIWVGTTTALALVATHRL